MTEFEADRLKKREERAAVHTAVDTLVAVVPALAVGTYFFGPRALLLTAIGLVCAVACVLVWGTVRGERRRSDGYGAAVTGVLTVMCLPVNAPLWLAAVAPLFAVLVGICLFGGRGRGIFCPPLLGAVFAQTFPWAVAAFQAPGVSRWLGLGLTVEVVGTDTPMAMLHTGHIPDSVTLWDLLLGQQAGALGQTAGLALILGGLYLLIRGAAPVSVPASYLATVAVLTWLLPMGGNDPTEWMLYQLLSGGLLLGAFFLAPMGAPKTRVGRVVYGVGCGIFTVLLRCFGAAAEGMPFAILLMNCWVWLLDRVFGSQRFRDLTAKFGRKGGSGREADP